VSGYADELRQLEETEWEDEQRLERYCATYDELRELRLGLEPPQVRARSEAVRLGRPKGETT
jgi:phage terminase small subunit